MTAMAGSARAGGSPGQDGSLDMRELALQALALCGWAEKTAAVAAIPADAPLDPDRRLSAPPQLPGRPDQPELVPPARLDRRSPGTPQGRAALLHALAHIEFNAINLALDAMWRFPGMPAAYYRDWLRVAREEAQHFELLRRHLQTLGYAYGDFPAHDGLWETASRTREDVLARLALVPRTLEARGLDASPAIRDKLARAGDAEGAAILDIILRDEIGHVAIGNHWFKWLCRERGLDPLAAYRDLAGRYGAARLKGPFNLAARRAAGFDEEELRALQSG